jgi:hypothetical protein
VRATESVRSGTNSAPTDRSWVMSTAQTPVPEQAPLQPAKAEPGVAVAVSVTSVPWA